MILTSERLELTKITPLRISRGVSTGTTNLFVQIEHDGLTGFGEMGPNGVSGDTAEDRGAPAHPGLGERRRPQAGLPY